MLAHKIMRTCCSAHFVGIMPNYFVPKVILSKDFIQQYLHIVSNMPIKMHIDTRLIAHNAFNGHQVLVHPVEVAFLVPHVTIHLFLKGFQFVNVKFTFCLGNCLCHLGITTYINLFGIISSTGKRWVNIHQVYLNTFIL